MIPDIKNPSPALESIVLDILSIQPRLTVKELYKLFLQKSNKKITVQAFYNLIRKLINQRILVKEAQVLLIDASWIDALLKFSDTVKKTYLTNEASISNIILRPGEKRDFTFDTVMGMDNFWTHALIIAAYYYRQSPHAEDNNVYCYNYHSWFHMARTDQEQSLADTYQQTGLHYYILSGSHLFLDQSVASVIDIRQFYYKTIAPTAMFEKNYYVTVIGDKIFEMRLPKYIHELMEEIYNKVTNIAEFDKQEILKVIQLPARTTLTISNNKKRAKEIRENIKKFFK